jgi:hypothetical protein
MESNLNPFIASSEVLGLLEEEALSKELKL